MDLDKWGIILVLVIIGGFAFVAHTFSGFDAGETVQQINPADQELEENSYETGKEATLSLAAYDETEDSATQVAADIHAWGDVYLGSQTGSTTDRTTFTSFVTGDKFEAIAFNDQYPYGKKVSGTIKSETKLENLEVYESVSTSNLGVTVLNDEGDDASGISLGADEQYAFNGVEISVNNNNVGYNPHIVTVDYTENVSSVDMPGAEEVEVPESADSALGDADAAFKISPTNEKGESFAANEGAPSMRGWDSGVTSSLVVTAESSGTASGDQIEVAVQDLAPYIDSGQELGFGVEDDASNPNNVGVGIVTDTVPLS